MNNNIHIPVGYRFKPDEDEIYSYFIPARLLHGQAMPDVGEVDLYSNSPNVLFEDRQGEDIYFFTSLKKEKASHNRAKRSAGGGTWQSQKPTSCIRVVNGHTVEIGTMRQYTFKETDGDWIMHEYAIDNSFLNYKLRSFPHYFTAHPDNLNPENKVFCHVYKKGKKDHEIEGNEETYKRRKISTDDNYECNVVSNTIYIGFDNNNNNVPSHVQELANNECNVVNNPIDIGFDNNNVPSHVQELANNECNVVNNTIDIGFDNNNVSSHVQELANTDNNECNVVSNTIDIGFDNNNVPSHVQELANTDNNEAAQVDDCEELYNKWVNDLASIPPAAMISNSALLPLLPADDDLQNLLMMIDDLSYSSEQQDLLSSFENDVKPS